MCWRRWSLGVFVLVLFSTGCQATGQGFVPSRLVAGDKATFGFILSASLTNQDFSGSYHDPQGITPAGVVDVDFKGSGGLHKCTQGVDPTCAKAPANTKGGCLVGLFMPYTSQNPKIPGTGTFDVLVCDVDGTGGGGQDFMAIAIDTGPCTSPISGPCPLPGPYVGYSNSGTPSGNISCTGCPPGTP